MSNIYDKKLQTPQIPTPSPSRWYSPVNRQTYDKNKCYQIILTSGSLLVILRLNITI